MVRKYLSLLFLVGIASVLFFLLYVNYVPTSDDMFYKFICNDINRGSAAAEVGEGTVYIERFSDVIKSMNWFYFHVNGRYLVHVAVQACTAMTSPVVYGVINSIFYALFLLLLIRISIRNIDVDIFSKNIICITAAWLLISFQGNTFLGGVAPSVNYLWTTVFMLSFILLHSRLHKADKKLGVPVHVLLFMFGVFVGSLQESFSIGLAGTYFFYLLYNRKEAKRSEWYLLIGLFVGACFCVFAPGNMVRLSSQGTSAGHSSFFLGCLSSWAFDALLISVAILLLMDRKRLFKMLLSNILFLGIIFFNSLFCIFIAYIGRHQLTCISVCSLIITLRMWGEYLQYSRTRTRTLAFVLLGASAFLYVHVYDLRKTRHDTFNALCQQAISKKGKSYVTCREYDDANYIVSGQPLICHYYVGFMPFVGDNCMKRALSLSLSKGTSINLLENLYPDEPCEIAKQCVSSNLVKDGVYRIFNNHYVFVSSQEVPTNKVKTTLLVKRRAFFLHDTEEGGHAKEHFVWKGKHYYLLGNRGSLSPIIGIKEIKIES